MTLSRLATVVATCVLLSLPAPVMARLTAASAFTDAPRSVFPLLERNTRLDMVDYYNSGSETSSRNRLDGQSRITSLTDNRLTASLTESSGCELVLLPAQGDTLVALIHTVSTPVPDSKVSFFTSDWNVIPTEQVFTAPVLTDWLTAAGKSDRSTVEGLVPFLLVSYSYDPATATLVLTNNTRKFLSDDVYSLVEDSLKPQLVYIWDGKRLRTK